MEGTKVPFFLQRRRLPLALACTFPLALAWEAAAQEGNAVRLHGEWRLVEDSRTSRVPIPERVLTLEAGAGEGSFTARFAERASCPYADNAPDYYMRGKAEGSSLSGSIQLCPSAAYIEDCGEDLVYSVRFDATLDENGAIRGSYTTEGVRVEKAAEGGTRCDPDHRYDSKETFVLRRCPETSKSALRDGVFSAELWCDCDGDGNEERLETFSACSIETELVERHAKVGCVRAVADPGSLGQDVAAPLRPLLQDHLNRIRDTCPMLPCHRRAGECRASVDKEDAKCELMGGAAGRSKRSRLTLSGKTCEQMHIERLARCEDKLKRCLETAR